jgi:autotransporter translocation and assembly factor TamB
MTAGKRRFPRRLAKGGLWLLAVLVVLVLFLWWGSGTEWTRLRVLRLAEARLEETLGREVRIGELEYGLRPFVVVARDVVIPGSRPEGPPFARVPEVRIELGYSGWFRPTLTVERVDLRQPEVWMVFYEDGTDNLPDVRTGEGGGRLEVVMGRLVVDGGVVHFDELDVPLSFDASPVQATLEGPAAVEALAEDHLVAELVAQDFDVLLPEAEPWEGGVTARAEITPGRIHVTSGRLAGPGLRARVEAVYLWDEDGRGGEVDVVAEGDAELANRLGYLEEEVDGGFRFVGEVDLAEAGVTYHGTLTSPELRFGERAFADLEARLSGGSGGLVVDVVEAAHAGGTLAGTVTLPVETDPAGPDEGRPVLVEARGEGLDVAALLDDLDLEGSPLAGVRGRAGAELTYRFTTDAPLAGDGGGVVRLAGVERRGDDRLPLSGRVPLEIDGGVLDVSDARLDGPGQVLTASGRYDLDAGSGRFRYHLTTRDLGRLARAVPLPAELTAQGRPPWLPTGGSGTVTGTVVLRPGGGYTVEANADLAAVESPAYAFDRVRAPLTFEDGALSATDLVLEGRGQRLMLSGRYDLDAEAADADFRLSSGDLTVLGDLVAGLGGGDAALPAWFPTAGAGSVEGELALAGGRLTGRAELDLSGVTLPTAGESPPVTFDRVAGSFRLAPAALRDLRLEASSGGGALIAGGALPLPPVGEGGAVRIGAAGWQRRELDLSLDAVDWPLATLLAFLPEPPALGGILDGELEVAGTLEAPRGRGDLVLRDATLPAPGGEPPVELDRVAASFRLTPTAVRELRLEAVRGDATVIVAGTAPLPPLGSDAAGGLEIGTAAWRQRPLDLTLRAERWPLPTLLAWAPGAPEITGTLSGAVAVEGTLEAPRGRGDVALAGVVVPGPGDAPPVALDRVAGTFRLTPGAVRDLRLEAVRGGSSLVVAGSAPLPPLGGDGAAGLDLGTAAWQRRPFDLSLRAVRWPLSTIVAWVPGAPAATGTLDGEAALEGTWNDPRGRGELAVASLRVEGHRVDRVSAELSYAGSRLDVRSLRAVAPAGVVEATGSWNRASGAIAARLDAEGLVLSEPPLAGLVPADLEGRVDLAARVDGTLEAPRVRLVSDAEGLALDGATLGDEGRARLRGVWDGEEVEVGGSLLGLVGFDGGGRLTTEMADLYLDLTVDDVGRLLRVTAGTVLDELDGSLAGTLQVSGRFDSPRGADVILRLDPVRLVYEGRMIENLEPVVLAYEPDRLVIESLFFGEPAAQGSGEVFVTGTIGLAALAGETAAAGEEGEESEAPQLPLDLRAQAEIDARWLELVLPDFDFEGRVQGLTTVGGTLRDPRLSGQAEVIDGQVLIPDFPHAAEDLDAVALFYTDRVVLDTATARLGGGRVRAAGSLGLTELMAGDVTYRFQVQVDDASVRYPEGFLLRGDANLALVSTPDGRLISGVVELERAFYLSDVPAGFSQLLGQVFQPSRLEAGNPDPGLAETELNVSILGPDALRVRNNVADLSGDLELVVRGNLADPALFGQVELDEGGDIVYAENEYTVSRGLLTFANPYEIDPVIDLVATTEVRNYDIILNLAGTLDRLDVSFTSDPPLADLEVVSLLTVGRPIGEGPLVSGDPAAGDPAAGGVDQAAQQLLYGQAASLVSERVNTLFGFDRFRLSPASGTSGTSSLAVTVGQQISRDVYVTYSRDPSVPEVDVLQVEWQVYDNVVVVLTSNGDRTYTLDVQIERKF